VSDIQSQGMQLLLTGLKNQHAVESQAISLLSRQVERLESYPEMEARMREHIDESKVQESRLEEILVGMNSSHSVLKDAGLSLTGNMAALMHSVAPDEIVKNSFANYAFEHFEIAAYRSLLALCDATGQTVGKSALQQSLNEEMAMAHWIDEHLEDTTQRYLQRLSVGLRADV
jgi:ferritin-like metal-binding protein YciE